jgi:hypothetical protein
MAMKHIFALLAVCCLLFRGDLAAAKETCTHAWGKGSFKSHQQLESELSAWLTHGKILRFSLCAAGSEHYFQVTILEASGKVRVIRLPARKE